VALCPFGYRKSTFFQRYGERVLRLKWTPSPGALFFGIRCLHIRYYIGTFRFMQGFVFPQRRDQFGLSPQEGAQLGLSSSEVGSASVAVTSSAGYIQVEGLSGHPASSITPRAMLISDRLWNQGRASWYRNLDDAKRRGITLLELIERRVQEWEARLKEAATWE